MSYEDDSLGHGVFSHALLETLRNHRQGDLDCIHLASEAQDRMYEWCRRDGQGRKQSALRLGTSTLTRKIVLLPGEAAQAPVSDLELSSTQGSFSMPSLTFGPLMSQPLDLLQGKKIICGPKNQLTEVVGAKPIGMPPNPKDGEVWTEPVTGMELVYVPGGRYQMGDTFGDGGSNEQPVHYVSVRSFWLGKYPVTQRQWEQVMSCNPSQFKKGSNYPVEHVSWEDAQEYIKKLNSKSGAKYRLPSEAEWEYAARSGGMVEKYAGTSDESRLGEYAWYGDNSDDSTHPVGQKKPNGLGVYDMSGNVSEWCQDRWHDTYDGAPSGGMAWESGDGSFRVFRSGSWSSHALTIRTAFRHGRRSGSPDGHALGFRLLLPVQVGER